MNLALGGAFVLMHIGLLFVLPLIGITPLWGMLAIAVVAVTTPAHWALVHDAIHRSLFAGRTANSLAGRMLAILFGVPFLAVRFAHLRHHRYNRTLWGREEVYDPRTRSFAAACIFHYLRITLGLYLGELALSVLCWLPGSLLRPHLHALCPDLEDGTRGMAPLADREVLSSPALRQIRTDAAVLMALYGCAFFLYGSSWLVLVGCLIARAFVISQLDHAAHHDTPLSERDYAYNLSAPRWLQALLLGFNVHRTHHQHPNLPWSTLVQSTDFRTDDISFVRGVFRQWRGPVALPEVAVGSLQPPQPELRDNDLASG